MRAGGSPRRRRRGRRQVSEINVVPYIDVMLVLLVIFMITAPLLRTGVEIDLPDADASPVQGETQEPLILSIDKAGQWYLNVGDTPDESITQDAALVLATAAIRLNPDKRVMVQGDTAVDYGQIMLAMVMLQKAGAPDIGLMAEPPG